MAFDYFSDKNYLVFLEWLFYLTLPTIVIICLISNSVEIENLKFVQKLVRNENGLVVISRLMILRLILCYFMLLPIFFIRNEIFLMILSGAVVVPFVGFFIPVF